MCFANACNKGKDTSRRYLVPVICRCIGGWEYLAVSASARKREVFVDAGRNPARCRRPVNGQTPIMRDGMIGSRTRKPDAVTLVQWLEARKALQQAAHLLLISNSFCEVQQAGGASNEALPRAGESKGGCSVACSVIRTGLLMQGAERLAISRYPTPP